MDSLYNTYLKMLTTPFDDPASDLPDISPEDYPALFALADRHCTLPFVLPYFRNTGLYPQILQKSKHMMLNYYQIDQFTRRTVSLLEKHGITCFVMKGISLAASYPVPEYRKLGDLDLYINDKDAFHCAEQILHENGYLDEEELSDHHTTYRYTFEKTGRSFLLELHYRVVGVYQYKPANQLIDEVFSAENLKAETQEINGSSYHVFPPTEYVFYMIHHMLKHYLYSGFGIRLLFDFSFYLEQHAQEVDFAKIHSWCQKSHILHLYESVLETCRIYLNLPEMIDPDVHYDLSDCDAFLSRILEDGDLGADVSQELVGSHSYKKVNLLTYFREGHLQMKVRFPKAGRCPLLWPVLWSITFFCFLKNTYTLRNTTFRETLQRFKKSNQKTQLIRIFENSDS